MPSSDLRFEPRKRKSTTDDADKLELARHYRFVPKPTSSDREQSTWQDRMVQHYHKHLYKEYVLADMSFVSEQRLGLRWRTQQEVAEGKGSASCGNKDCPSHGNLNDQKQLAAAIIVQKPSSAKETEERSRLAELRYGDDQVEYEVPFSYVEENKSKMELVKLRLCAKCAPLLFLSKSRVDPCVAACGDVSGPTEEPPGHRDESSAWGKPSITGPDETGNKRRLTHKTDKKRKKKSKR